MTRLKLGLTLALAGLPGCAEPEQLDTTTDTGLASAPQVAQSATGNAAAVWHMKAMGAASHEVHFFHYDAVSGWSGPTNLGLGAYPDVALADSGRALVVYGGKARVFDGVAWSAEQTIAPSGVTMPSTHPVAVDAQGNGMVIFAASSNAWIVEYDVASGWDSAMSLSSAATGEWTAIDMNTAGQTVAAFCESSNKLIAAFRPAGMNSWSKKTVGTNCCHSIGGGLGQFSYPIQASISETGDAIVIGSNASTQVCAVRYDHVAGWGNKVTLQANVMAEFPSVAMNASGDAITAWRDVGAQMHLRRYVFGTGWSALTAGPNTGDGGLGVGINEADNIAAVYTSGPSVYYVVQSPGGTVSAPITISTLPSAPYYLDTASTPLGLGLVGWNQSEDLWVSRRE